MDIKKLRIAYSWQKHNSKLRGIEWNLSFGEWLDFWEKSGKLPYRGKTKGCYCMCRTDDTGPYSIDNIRIDTVKNNLRERWSKPVKINGIIYSSITLAARELGIRRTTLNYRIRKGYVKVSLL
jgi:hypothetical protein